MKKSKKPFNFKKMSEHKKCGKKCKCVEVTQDVCTQGIRCTLEQYLNQRVFVRTSLSFFGLPTWHSGIVYRLECGTVTLTDVEVFVGTPFGSGFTLELTVTLPLCSIQSVFQQLLQVASTVSAASAGAAGAKKAESKESIVDVARRLAKGT